MAPIIMPVDMVMGMGMAAGAMGGRGGRGRCAALHPCDVTRCRPAVHALQRRCDVLRPAVHWQSCMTAA